MTQPWTGYVCGGLNSPPPARGFGITRGKFLKLKRPKALFAAHESRERLTQWKGNNSLNNMFHSWTFWDFQDPEVPLSYGPRMCLMMQSVSEIHCSIFTRTWLHYVRVFAIANPSVVCNVRAPYSRGWNFRQYFFAILHLGHPLTSVQYFTEIVPGKPFLVGIKRKTGSEIERCHVRISHCLKSLLFTTLWLNTSCKV